MKTFAGAVTLILAVAASAEDDGRLVIEIPSAVQATIAREKGDAGKVQDFRKVNESDGTTYLVKILMDGKAFELSLDAGGQLMQKHLATEDGGPKMMRIEAVPAKVRQTLQREAGAGVIDEIEMTEEKTKYVTEVRIGERKYHIEVDADGTLLTKGHVPEESGGVRTGR